MMSRLKMLGPEWEVVAATEIDIADQSSAASVL